MSKKDYIDAVNEIKVNEELKQETLKKVTNTKKHHTDLIKFIQ